MEHREVAAVEFAFFYVEAFDALQIGDKYRLPLLNRSVHAHAQHAPNFVVEADYLRTGLGDDELGGMQIEAFIDSARRHASLNFRCEGDLKHVDQSHERPWQR